MKLIRISNYPKYFTVDDEDEYKVNQYTWNLEGGSRSIIQAKIGEKSVSIGRFLLNYDGPDDVDHIDRNIYNNKKSNLRVITHAQNAMNTPFRDNNTTGYKGVSYDEDRNKYRSHITVDGVQLFLGRFKTKEEAALAYNTAALKYYGAIAWLNKL